MKFENVARERFVFCVDKKALKTELFENDYVTR